MEVAETKQNHALAGDGYCSPFSVDWIKKYQILPHGRSNAEGLPFDAVQHLTNSLAGDQPLNKSRNGQELDTRVHTTDQ